MMEALVGGLLVLAIAIVAGICSVILFIVICLILGRLYRIAHLLELLAIHQGAMDAPAPEPPPLHTSRAAIIILWSSLAALAAGLIFASLR